MSPHSSDPLSNREVEASTNDELSLDKETLKDLDARGDGVAGQLGAETVLCPTESCVTCFILCTTVGLRAH